MPMVGVTASELEGLKERGVRLIAAVGAMETGVIAAQEMDFRSSCAVMIGNEGSGLAAEWLEMSDVRVTIPCPGDVESLNAAVAGVCCCMRLAGREAESSEAPSKMRGFFAPLRMTA